MAGVLPEMSSKVFTSSVKQVRNCANRAHTGAHLGAKQSNAYDEGSDWQKEAGKERSCYKKKVPPENLFLRSLHVLRTQSFCQRPPARVANQVLFKHCRLDKGLPNWSQKGFARGARLSQFGSLKGARPKSEADAQSLSLDGVSRPSAAVFVLLGHNCAAA